MEHLCKFIIKAKIPSAHAYTEGISWNHPDFPTFDQSMYDAKQRMIDRLRATFGQRCRIVFVELIEEVYEYDAGRLGRLIRRDND